VSTPIKAAYDGKSWTGYKFAVLWQAKADTISSILVEALSVVYGIPYSLQYLLLRCYTDDLNHHHQIGCH
jgi:hypothetical protein